jgi:hypothetical protein
LLWVNVKLLSIHYSRTLDSLPRGAINATEDHIDLILLDELSSFGFRYTIYSCTVLKVQIYLSPPFALMSLTPTLMDGPTEVFDSFIAFSPLKTVYS